MHHMHAGAQKDQKMASNTPQLALQVVGDTENTTGSSLLNITSSQGSLSPCALTLHWAGLPGVLLPLYDLSVCSCLLIKNTSCRRDLVNV